MHWGFGLFGGFLAAALLAQPGAATQDQPRLPGAKAREAIARKALAKVPPHIDASPLPRYTGDFVSLGADGIWNKSAQSARFLTSDIAGGQAPSPDCSREAIIHYARRRPSAFEADKKGLLYGVQTYTPETRVKTRYWDMPGFNSCALVVYAILKRAGCGWAGYTADAKAIYDMAYDAGWRPSAAQQGRLHRRLEFEMGRRRGPGSATGRSRRGRGTTRFRHVGITTGALLSVDNTLLARPSDDVLHLPADHLRAADLPLPARRGQAGRHPGR